MTIPRPISPQPIPKNASKVFQGEIFDVYQWQQKMFDGSSQTFEKIKRADTVGILPITADNKIILTKQEQPGLKPFITLLGGRVDPDEDVLQTAKRELLEESGFKAKDWVLWEAKHFFSKIDWAIYNFVAKDLSQVQAANPDSGEKIKLIYLSFDEFIDLASDENFRDLEVALKILRLKDKPAELKKLKKLLSN